MQYIISRRNVNSPNVKFMLKFLNVIPEIFNRGSSDRLIPAYAGMTDQTGVSTRALHAEGNAVNGQKKDLIYFFVFLFFERGIF